MRINVLAKMRSRNLFWQIPLFGLLCAPIWWGLVADFLAVSSVPQTRDDGGKPVSSFAMHQVLLSQAESGKEELRLEAVSVTSENDQDRLVLESPVTHLVGNQDSPVTITSNSAIYETKKNIITLLEDVQLFSADSTVTTSVMRYLTKYKKVKSAAEVELNGDGMQITGTSFFYDLVSGDFRVGKRVVCTLW